MPLPHKQAPGVWLRSAAFEAVHLSEQAKWKEGRVGAGVGEEVISLMNLLFKLFSTWASHGVIGSVMHSVSFMNP